MDLIGRLKHLQGGAGEMIVCGWIEDMLFMLHGRLTS
jgi:hypothetical protein